MIDTLRLDAALLGSVAFDLFHGSESRGTAFATTEQGGYEPGCAAWPRVSLRDVAGLPVDGNWRVAFPQNRVQSQGFDSLPSLVTSDSLKLTIEIARSASRVEGDTAAVFRGRPYVVRQANRFGLPGDLEGILAEVVRVVPQEANPVHEQLIMILEMASGATSPKRTAFYLRQIGLEEHLESIELLAVLRIAGRSEPSLLLRRDGETGTSFLLLDRVATGSWLVRWRSAYAGC